MEGQKKISVIVPCYNEEGNVRAMAETLVKILEKTQYDYEIIFTDNASTDSSPEIIRELTAKNKKIKALFNNRNYGTSGRSARNARKYLTGDAIITIPCDFQEPPELISEFIRYWEEGYKVVCGQKIGSKEGQLKYKLRCLYYKIIQIFSDIPQYENISGITLLDKEVQKELLKTDKETKLRFALADMGYDIKLIQYVQQKRRSGKSSYNVWRYLTFAIDSMVTTSTAPLRIATVMGCVMSAVSFILAIIYLIMKLILWNRFQAGIAPVLIGMLFIGSIQLLFLGILGEYIGVILRKVTREPDVILREKINFDEENNVH